MEDKKTTESGLSRRSFLSGAALGTAGIALAGLAACGPGNQNTAEAETEDQPSTAATVEQAAETRETEVLVVGLGASGLHAAVGAAAKGAQVIAIEQASSMIGTTNISTSGFLCVGDKLQLEQPFAYTVSDMYNFLNHLSNYSFNTQSLKAILEASSRASNMFIDAGLPLRVTELPEKVELTGAKAGQLCGHAYLTKGEEKAEIFDKMIDEAGVEALYNTTAKALLIENDEIVGLQCDSNGVITDIKAKSIVLCTGGFLGNKEMVAHYFSGAEIVPMGNANCIGAGINLALDAGAQIGKSFSISGNEYGGANFAASPTFSFRPDTGSNEALRLVLLGGIIVNANGERFISEEVANKEAMHCAEPFIRENSFYAVVDQDFVDYVAVTSLGDLMGDGRMKTMFADVYADTLYDDLETAVSDGWAAKAETIAGLAEAFGLTNLESTIATYNSYCDAGEDPDYYVAPEFLKKVATPPFYVIQSYSAGWLSLGGIKSDASGHALDPMNQPIPHLFVAGADADLFCTPYLAGGSANGFALASGLIAGETASAEALA